MYNFKLPNLSNVQNIGTTLVSNINKVFSDIFEQMQNNLQKQEENLRILATKQGIAFPLSLPIQMMYAFKFNQSNDIYACINYTYWVEEENFHFISYIQEEVNQVYKNYYVNEQFNLMKRNDLNLFVPFLLVLIEKLCRKIINKEDDRIHYSTITNKLVEEWEEIVSINNIDEFISNYYKAIFDQVINKQIYSDEKNYIPNYKNYNRHRILHAKSNFDEFTIEKTSNLLFVVMFLVDIINLKNEL